MRIATLARRVMVAACIASTLTVAGATQAAAQTPPNYTVTTSTDTLLGGTTDIGNHCDDCTTTIALPFPVTFYGVQYTQAVISSNGNVQFGTNSNNLGGCVPGGPNGPMIALFWDDLRTDGAGDGIFTRTITNPTSGAQTFVIEWRTTFFAIAGTANFELRLYSNFPTITAVYGASTGSAANGASAGAGVQSSASGPATSYSCNTASLTNGLRIDYVPGGNTGGPIECTPARDSNPEGTVHSFTCTAYIMTASGRVPDPDGVRLSFDVISGPNAEEVAPQRCQGTTASGQPIYYGGPGDQGTTTVRGAATDANGRVVCTYRDNTTSPTTGGAVSSPVGTDTILVYRDVNAQPGRTDPDPGVAPPATNDPQVQIFKSWVDPARTLTCSPRTATNPTGTNHTVTCTVRDATGAVVSGQYVVFTETGAGAIVQPTTMTSTTGSKEDFSSPEIAGHNYGVTGANGQVQVVTRADGTDTGAQVITATLAFNCRTGADGQASGCRTAEQQSNIVGRPQECEQTSAPAGNCTDTVNKQWVAAQPTSPAPTTTVTTTTTPSTGPCTSATQASVGVTVNPSTILAGQASTVRVTAPVGSTVELLARTSGGTYAVVRTVTVPAGGAVDFLLSPRFTTRVAARACGFISLAQPIVSVVARVSLAVSSLPGCVLRFSGSTLPVKPGQVVNVYYRSGGSVTVAMQARTSTTGSYVAQRRFLACGQTLTFFARTNGDVHNLPGQSADQAATVRR